jgi:hypothetical protein
VVDASLVPSKLFPLDRMLAIFHVIFDGERMTGDIYSQLSSLLSLNLLTRSSLTSVDPLDDIKLRCNCSYVVMARLAVTLGFELQRYMHAVL